MDIKGTVGRLKPVLGGAVGGIVVAMIIAFSLNWIYTAGAMAESVRQAKIDVLTQVCENNAERYWTEEQNKKMADLEGWDNEQRSDLAKQFAPDLPNTGDLREDIIDACDEALEPA